MPLSIGIVGLPNVGKSTLFQAITKKQVDCSNYPFCTIDPNVGVVAVPDERLDKLADLLRPDKKIPTTIEFVDIAGLVKGAAQGEGLGNRFLANIRQTDAIIYILRCFQNEKIINTQNEINPLNEKEVLDMEMALKDLETIEKRIQDLEKDVKANKKEAEKELEILNRVKNLLKEGRIIIGENWTEEEKNFLNSFQLLTLKPRLYLLNAKKEEVDKEIIEIFEKNNWSFLIMDVLNELEAAGFSKQERKELGLAEELELDNLIKKSYELLDLITFFTTESKELKAWTLKKGQTAPQAGGKIHTDFQEHFIKAEVINWRNLIEAGSFAKAREKGLIRTEGKEYIVQDGDVIEIKI